MSAERSLAISSFILRMVGAMYRTRAVDIHSQRVATALMLFGPDRYISTAAALSVYVLRRLVVGIGILHWLN